MSEFAQQYRNHVLLEYSTDTTSTTNKIHETDTSSTIMPFLRSTNTTTTNPTSNLSGLSGSATDLGKLNVEKSTRESKEFGRKSRDVRSNTMTSEKSERLLSEDVNRKLRVSNMCANWWSGFMEVLSRSLIEIRSVNPYMLLMKARILFVRAWFRVRYRTSMVIVTTLTILYLALVFGWILGDSNDEGTTVTGLVGIGTMCITLANLQFVFFMHTNNQVIMKIDIRYVLTLALGLLA